jgi:peptidoglycan/xylan/chitin deacetylase (PgdA/CDA1 family)
MLNNPAMVKVGLDLMHYSGASELGARALRGSGCIFCLHEVRPRVVLSEGFEPNHQLAISPEFLDQVITMVKGRGYALVSLAELTDYLRRGSFPKSPVAAFTLDDGYKNNAELAAPVFQAHDSPYTIFVAPGFAEATHMLWWLELERLVATSTSVEGMPSATPDQKAAVWRKLSTHAKSLTEFEQRKWLDVVFTKHGANWRNSTRDTMMNWDEVRALNRDPLCTIGAHTLGHYALKRLSRDDAAHEMIESKRRTEAELGESVNFFAYPYGDKDHAGTRDFELAEEVGFKASVTTRKGVITARHKAHMQALPRVMISGRYQRTRQLKTLMNGLPFFMSNRFRRTVVD